LQSLSGTEQKARAKREKLSEQKMNTPKQEKVQLLHNTVLQAVAFDQGADYVQAVQSYNAAVKMINEILSGMEFSF
jgi:hypothetical protein